MNVKILVVLAAIGLISVGGISFAEVDLDEVDSEKVKREIPAWEKNILYRDGTPETKAGFKCQHGHMTRSCPSPVE